MQNGTKVGHGLRPFVEQQVDDGQVGHEPEFVFKNLVVRGLQPERVVVLLGVLGMNQQPRVVLGVGLEIRGDSHFPVDAQQLQQGLCELEVEVENPFVFLLVERLEGVLVVEVVRGVVVGRFDGAPVGALPWRGVFDTDIFDHTHPAVMHGGDDEIQRPVAVHDDRPVAVGLFLVPLLTLDGCVSGEQQREIFDRREVGGGKQDLVHR